MFIFNAFDLVLFFFFTVLVSYLLLNSSFRIRPPAKCGEEDTSTTWAYLTVVQPTKRGRKDR